MRLLLDTHTFLWHADASPQMSPTSSASLSDATNDLFLSMASVWEIAIKVGLKKLTLSNSFAPFMTRAISGYGIVVLPITFDDCVEYEKLAFPLPKHRDPFDRLIIVHARRNALTIVGADVEFDAYGVTRIW